MYTVPTPCFFAHVIWRDDYGNENSIPVSDKISGALQGGLSALCISKARRAYAQLADEVVISRGEEIFIKFYQHEFPQAKPSNRYRAIGETLMVRTSLGFQANEMYCADERQLRLVASHE